MATFTQTGTVATAGTTVVEICNTALVLLGAEKITALTDSTDRADACELLYEQAKRDVFEMHNWRCLTKRAALSTPTTPTGETWAYSFALPAGTIRILDAEDEDLYPFSVENNYYLTNNDAPIIRYIFDETTPGNWDEWLISAVVYRLAYLLSIPITGDNETHLRMKDAWGAKIAEAVGRDDSLTILTADGDILGDR